MTPEELTTQLWPQIKRSTSWARAIISIPETAEPGQTIKIIKDGPSGTVLSRKPIGPGSIVEISIDDAIKYLISCPRLDAISEILDGAERLASKI